MSRTHPARFFRASALGVLAAGLLVPATASAQGPVPSSTPLYAPTFQAGQSVPSGSSGPVRFLLRGAFTGGAEPDVVAVSDGAETAEGDLLPATIARFGRTPSGYDAIGEPIPLAGEEPVAALAADLYAPGSSVAVVASRGKYGHLQAVDLHGNGTSRGLQLDGQPVAIAVGEFLPGRGRVVAVSLEDDRLAFYRPFEDTFALVQEFSGVKTGPLSSGPTYSGTTDALITTADDGVHGVRRLYSESGNPAAPFGAQEQGTTSAAFGTSMGLVAADEDANQFRWYTTHQNGLTSVAAFTTTSSPSLVGYGPVFPATTGLGAPIAMDLYGHDARDTVVALDGAQVRAFFPGDDVAVVGPLQGGRTATALDFDGDHREELVVAEGAGVTLYRNETGTQETKPTLGPAAVHPSVYDATNDRQVVTSRTFDVSVPTGTDDAYECALGSGDWTACSSSSAPAFTVQADGSYDIRVRRKAQGHSFWSAEQTIKVRVDTSAPAKPKLVQSPAAVTNSAAFEYEPAVDGTRIEYRIDHGSWQHAPNLHINLWDLQEGQRRVSFRAVNTLRDVPSEEVDVDFLLDKTDPLAPTKIAGPDTITTKRTATFSFEGEPDATFECLVDQQELKGADGVAARIRSPWEPCASSKVLEDLELGEHTVSVRQVDAAGNRGEASSWTWTIVAPEPEPVVETPAPVVEAPAPTDETVTVPPTAKTPDTAPAPAATPVPPTKPDEAKPAEPKPVAAKLSVGAPAGKGKTPVATSTGRRVAVGCAAPGAEDYRCAVTVTRGGKQVGQGRRTGAGVVPVNLDRATARKVQRLGGLKVRVTLTVKTADGETRKTQKTVRILPKKVVVVPTDGLFAFDSATPSKGADALAKAIAGQLDGARTITIVGHTDAKGSADVNRRLGRERAEAFRLLLAKHGFDGKVAVDSAGDTKPRASNATDGGRALNRRVEIDVRY
ncbi:OmpA family protein [Patulibacter americanus]|uniref:OmpA family protein n=1 Tax=Patulibacter americanus TaxID=588672 RepID=UPI0003B59CE8|nr:OmpA family protein [Patulibacter americanus]